MPDMFSAAKGILGHRRLPAALVPVAIIIMLPALRAGLVMDDIPFRAVLLNQPRGGPALAGRADLSFEHSKHSCGGCFDLFTGPRTARETQLLRYHGLLPWWSSDNLRASFWRPLASFSHWLDYRLFPDRPALMHLENMLLFAGIVYLAAVLYRQLMTPAWAAGLAAVLFLLDENNYFPVMWIANRCLLLSLVFGLLAILAHHRWRSDSAEVRQGGSLSRRRTTGSTVAAVGAPLCLLLSLLSAESGIATAAYLCAYGFCLDRTRPCRRLVSLIPAATVVILWQMTYSFLGHGFRHSGMYLNPFAEPLQFAAAIVERLPVLLSGQLGWQLPDALNFVSDGPRFWLWIKALVFAIWVAATLTPVVLKDRLARFWSVAMLLTALPVCATLPMSRLLLFVAVPGFGLVGEFVSGVLLKEKWLPKHTLWRVSAPVLCAVLLFIHLPLAAAGRFVAPRISAHISDEVAVTMRVSDAACPDNRDVILVNAPDPVFVFFPFLKAHKIESLPDALWALAPAFQSLQIIRSDENSLIVRAKGGNLFSCPSQTLFHFCHFFRQLNGLFRSGRSHAQVGDQVALQRLTIEVMAVDRNAQPTELAVRFPISADDSALCWVYFDWQKNRYLPFTVPAIGQNTEIPGPPHRDLAESIQQFGRILLGPAQTREIP